MIYKIILEALRAESKARADIPELGTITRSAFIDSVDWELRRAAEATKKLGVTAWSLLGGLAAVSWLIASAPELRQFQIGQCMWAFLLIECAFLVGEIIWTAMMRRPETVYDGRAVHLSALGGPAVRAELGATAFRFSVVSASLIAMPPGIPAMIKTVMVVVFLLAATMHAILLIVTKFDILFNVESDLPKATSQVAMALVKFFGFIGPFFLAPIVVWAAAVVLEELPKFADFRVGGLIVAACYLLRCLLTYNAETRIVPLLEQLRRDVSFGFIPPPEAALQMARAIGGLPSRLYIPGRLRAMTQDACGKAADLWQVTEKLLAAAAHFESLSNEKKSLNLEHFKEWFNKFPKIGSRVSFRGSIEKQSLGFLASLPPTAKKSVEYVNWIASSEALDAIGNEYLAVHSGIEALLKTPLLGGGESNTARSDDMTVSVSRESATGHSSPGMG